MLRKLYFTPLASPVKFDQISEKEPSSSVHPALMARIYFERYLCFAHPFVHRLLLLTFITIIGFSATARAQPRSVIVRLADTKALSAFTNPENPVLGRRAAATRLLVPALHIYALDYYGPFEGDSLAFLRKISMATGVLQAQWNHRGITRRAGFNDSLYPFQYNLHAEQPGQYGLGMEDLKKAWDGLTLFGSVEDTIVVAFLDEGFDNPGEQHPDIRYRHNHAEKRDGIDNDGNGYIDDLEGWNTSTNNDSISGDDHGLGSASVAAALRNNKIGIAGVANGTPILRININIDEEESVIAGYGYALAQRLLYNKSGGKAGTLVVATNSSFGYDLEFAEAHPIWCGMYDELGKAGILSFVATTNNNVDVDALGDMPSTCGSDYMVVITNVDKNARIIGGFGKKYVDMGAPGMGVPMLKTGGRYTTASGTSFATPHATGAAAVLYSMECPLLREKLLSDPAGTARAVKYALLDHARPYPEAEVSARGHLDLNRAVNSIQNAAPATALYTLCRGPVSTSLPRILGLYPNPGADYFTLAPELSARALDVSVLDIAGRALAQFTIPPMTREYILNAGEWAPGVYLIRTEQGQTLRWVRR